MALSAKLTMRQGQTMVLTPQLLQAIKLLQMPNMELAAFIENELASNPLLERAEDHDTRETERLEGAAEAPAGEGPAEPGDWASDSLDTDPGAMAAKLGTEIENAFDADLTAPSAGPTSADALSAGSWAGVGGGGPNSGDAPDLEAYVSETASLQEHLERQAGVVLIDPVDRMIGRALIDGLDQAGYFIGSLDDIAERLGTTGPTVAAVLVKMQTLEPTGVFARTLAECLELQLRERDRFDPAMQAMIANLPALARRDFALLRRVCGVDDEDLADMIAEIRRLEPKPGRAFGDLPGAPAIPDVYVFAAPDRSWRVELNSQALPRVLVNETYAAVIRRGAAREEDKQYVSTQLQSANWLTKSLEQRARTILNVASEIVRRQDAFLVEGVSALRPLNLKMIGEAIGVHESTVSRATAHKFIQTPRGLFEMKYFFTAAIASADSGESHSAEAVRQRIRQMIDEEDPGDVLSDDSIVERLRKVDIVVARRTVAKYRDSLRIPSSVERRKMKMSPVGSPRARGDSFPAEA
ncbi:RNA polymerase RpoN-/SigL-like sigma 54 subunit [Roseiarcus fermentans]|uniref:RNA polymerase sigma-54 factor n=1 Tax=Roseiarcus fermentans TaxID=1473586 RepID=A0A366FNH2_9HYPH|nr:RNA polymerase factor sigma-54 [Roseiarcus fermentans]RBP16178.1 RNA polymerase RpoN-/SigL-like sigma 54 subunit [Roseiarcus fermentans]